jgi:aminoglycoside phosphotransferase (APT) family kinase protein
MRMQMNDSISLYQERLNLHNAIFTRIEHEEAMVALVYKITLSSGTELILKICDRPNDFAREVYFLKYFAGVIPVPRIVDSVEPAVGIHGAILMECLPGASLPITDFTDALAYEMGSLLARIHCNRTTGYGDLIFPYDLHNDPRIYFTQKFQEGMAECANHLPETLLDQCQQYYEKHSDLLLAADGPCITHRDFRPGNVLVDNGTIQGIIDWSSARASFAQEDFCAMEHREWPTFSSTKNSFLAGYASIRPVPNYSDMMPLLRLSRAIAVIGFTVKRGTWRTSNAQWYQFNRQYLENYIA